MSTTNAAVAALQQNLDKARELFAKRLLPAKLKVEGDEGIKNGRVLKAWLVRKDLQGSLGSMSPQAICDELYRAIQDDVQQPLPQLVWEVAPKALTKRTEQKGPAKVADSREASTFEQKAHEGDAALKAQKIQDEAKKRVISLVEGFTPVRRGVLKYALRDEMQKKWKERIAKGGDFVAMERDINQEQRKVYESLERPEQV